MNLPAGLVDSVGFVLSKLAQRVTRQAELRLVALGLQARHVGLMMLISEAGPRSQKFVGEALLIDRTTMVQLVDKLESLGLAERRPDPADRRVGLLHLTANGAEMLRQARSLVEDAEAELLSGLAAEDRELFRRLLVQILQNGPKE